MVKELRWVDEDTSYGEDDKPNTESNLSLDERFFLRLETIAAGLFAIADAINKSNNSSNTHGKEIK